jgi:hypothetical protein
MRKFLGLFILFNTAVLFMASISCAHYSRGPWAGRVIDAETKEPIEGAAVLAAWEESYALPPGGGTALIKVVETRTDKEGNFKISAKSFFAMLPGGEIYGPHIIIYKPRYKVIDHTEYGMHISKNKSHEYPKGWKGYFEKPDAVVELTKFKTREERIKNLPDSTPFSGDMDEKKIKFYIHLINIERIELGFKPYPEH